jgi:glycine/D-amino acid oxidase-like deaminating enzyme
LNCISLRVFCANKLIIRDPRLLCQFLLQSCLDRGVKLHHPAKAVSIRKNDQGELTGIRISNTETKVETDLPGTSVLISAGAWSPQVFSTLFRNSKRKLPLSSLAGYSLVVRSPTWGNNTEDCHAVFTTEESGYSPEIFSRANGEIYIAGLNSAAIPLPSLPGESNINKECIRMLEKTAKRVIVAGQKDDLEIVRKGLCFRPVTARGTPILGRIPDQDLGGIKTKRDGEGGVWLAAGHGPWGISMSLGTGKVMAEMIQGKPTSARVSELGL